MGKPTDSKTCTKFGDNLYLTKGDILQVPLVSTHAQKNKKLLLIKSPDPLNLSMTPKFSNKGSLITTENCRDTDNYIIKLSCWNIELRNYLSGPQV